MLCSSLVLFFMGLPSIDFKPNMHMSNVVSRTPSIFCTSLTRLFDHVFAALGCSKTTKRPLDICMSAMSIQNSKCEQETRRLRSRSSTGHLYQFILQRGLMYVHGGDIMMTFGRYVLISSITLILTSKIIKSQPENGFQNQRDQFINTGCH